MKTDDTNEYATALALEIEKRQALALKLTLYEDLILHQTGILEQNHAEIQDHLSLIKFQAQYNESQNRKLTERSHELRTYYNAIQGLSEVTRLVTFSEIDQKFALLANHIDAFNTLNDANSQATDSDTLAAKLKDIKVLESNIASALGQASANLVIIEQSSKAGVIYSSLILTESEVSQGAEVVTETVDFNQIINDSVNMFKEGKLAIKEIQLKCKFERIGRIDSSKYHLQVIINNLIANAINYTPQNGQISLIVTAKINAAARSLVFIVQDSGVGISAENINKIREKFKCGEDDNQSFDRFSDTDTQGSGFGLLNVLRSVAALNGEIGVKSRGVGQGSTFVVSLPLDDVKPSK